MRKTTNYGLALYDKEDKMNITSEENSLNHNMELIDSALKEKASSSELHTHTNKEILDNISQENVENWNNKSEFSGDYSELSNKPTIPTKVSELENDKKYLTSIPTEYVTDSKLSEKSYATETYVSNKIAEAELSGGEVDLSGYATKDELKSKVDKVSGKSLIADSEIERLANVTNYDDTELTKSINDITTHIGSLENLNTEEKTNLVNAINEVVSSSGSCKITELTDVSYNLNNIEKGVYLLTNMSTQITYGTNKTFGVYNLPVLMIKTGVTALVFDGDYIKLYFSGTSYVYDIKNLLTKDNTTSYTPYSDYNPATKKYVDDAVKTKASITDMTNYIEEHKDELKGADGKDGINGTDGIDGKDGNDGYSPIAKVTQTDTGATITITDKNGTTTTNITNGKDGVDGSKGADGYTPVKGTDYWTEEDKTEIVAETEVDLGIEKIPDYVVKEAERVAKTVQSHQNENTFSFIACSDIHYSVSDANTKQMYESLKHAGQGMKLVRDMVHIDFAAMLGDIIWDGASETKDDVLASMLVVNKHLFPAFSGLPNFRTEGNHDSHGNNTSAQLTKKEIYANIGAFNDDASVYYEEDKVLGVFYTDFNRYKLRVICLNLNDASNGQKEFFSNAITTAQEGWRILVLSHQPLHEFGTTYTSVLPTDGSVICAINGHCHNNKVGTLTNSETTYITIPSVSPYRRNECATYAPDYINGEYNEDGTVLEYPTAEKTKGTAGDTSFCVVTIDLEAGKVYADHYGTGKDREINFSTGAITISYSITNNLTNVTTNNDITSITKGETYTATITPISDNYLLEDIQVTMDGKNVTSDYVIGGTINIPNVTGDIIVTATANIETPIVPSEPTYTNILTTAQAIDSVNPYNGIGYKNGCYLSSSNPFEGTDAATVLTGYISYNVPQNGLPATIYIKGAEWQAISHCRLGVFKEKTTSSFVIVGNNTTADNQTNINHMFNVETISDKYIKLTPKYWDSAGYSKFAYYGTTGNIFLRMSLVGAGENLIITLDEPIE